MNTIEGRDDHGRFKRGNTFGRGRPRKEIERDYLSAIRDACSSEDVKEIFGKVVEQAKQGDLKAARFVIEQFVGSREPHDLTQIAIDEQLGYDPVEEAVQGADAMEHLRIAAMEQIPAETTEEGTSPEESDEIPSPV